MGMDSQLAVIYGAMVMIVAASVVYARWKGARGGAMD